VFLDTLPQAPWVGFAEFIKDHVNFCEAEQRFLLLFLEKEENYIHTLECFLFFWGMPRNA
jgi:hypothetical protein